MPLRVESVFEKEKSSRRESKLGFRSLFGRHRAVNEIESINAPHQPPTKQESVLSPPSQPYASLTSRSEVHIADVASPALRPKTSGLKSPTFAGSNSPTGMFASATKRRGSLATWDPPPLFQAWPQATRHAMLPACVQADSLLRIHGKKENLSNLNHPDLGDQGKVFVEMAKRKHRRNSSSFKFDWTTKLYILCTSGYLLQYATDGTHDRLPEKMLALTKDSAAFASDVIPGRHWVLQIASVFDTDAADTRSLLGRFSFKEKRQTADILMVFENADEMNSWMVTLRREIEALGGKKAMTETGKLKDDNDHQAQQVLPLLSHQRTLVFKSPQGPQRMSRAMDGHELRWDADITLDGPDLRLGATLTEMLPEPSFEDDSKTNSFVSHDGRQLDGLRESSNRFSFMSSGQRTIVTSDSSPSNSPLRNSFGSQLSQSDDVTRLAEAPPEIRPRPNASAILDRRASVQTGSAFIDPISFHDLVSNDLVSRVTPAPNFSLPNWRRSVIPGPTPDPVRAGSAASRAPPARRARRPPPSSLGLSRPLSIVADSPSPGKQSPEQHSAFSTANGAFSDPPGAPLYTTWSQQNSKNHASQLEYDLSSHAPSSASARTSFHVTVHTSPRKYASMNSLRPADTSRWTDASKSTGPTHMSVRPQSPDRFHMGGDRPRSKSSIGSYASKSQSPAGHATMPKRSSMFEQHSSETLARRASSSTPHSATSPFPHQPQSMISVSHQYLKGHSGNNSGGSTQSLMNRRSLPQLAEGPPPAPPPTRSLPPLPPKSSKRRAESIPRIVQV